MLTSSTTYLQVLRESLQHEVCELSLAFKVAREKKEEEEEEEEKRRSQRPMGEALRTNTSTSGTTVRRPSSSSSTSSFSYGRNPQSLDPRQVSARKLPRSFFLAPADQVGSEATDAPLLLPGGAAGFTAAPLTHVPEARPLGGTAGGTAAPHLKVGSSAPLTHVPEDVTFERESMWTTPFADVAGNRDNNTEEARWDSSSAARGSYGDAAGSRDNTEKAQRDSNVDQGSAVWSLHGPALSLRSASSFRASLAGSTRWVSFTLLLGWCNTPMDGALTLVGASPIGQQAGQNQSRRHRMQTISHFACPPAPQGRESSIKAIHEFQVCSPHQKVPALVTALRLLLRVPAAVLVAGAGSGGAAATAVRTDCIARPAQRQQQQGGPSLHWARAGALQCVQRHQQRKRWPVPRGVRPAGISSGMAPGGRAGRRGFGRAGGKGE